MIRSLYSLLMLLAQPFLRARLKRRGAAEPGYLQAVEERFGHYTAPAGQGFVWLHAVSLGETRAAAILLKALRAQMPGMRLLLTHGTATGREEGARLLQPGDVQVWQPWDTPGAVGRFLAHFQPRLGLLMETEVWPNMVGACRSRGLPLVLVNARLSDKSLGGAQRLAWLARPAYGALAAVYAQTEADAQRLRQLGAPVRGVFGNLKFDAEPSAAQLAQGRAWRAGLQGPVLMLASSREGEEKLLLEQISAEVRTNPHLVATESIANGAPANAQWLIVPRHPQRFDEVAALAVQYGFAVSRRSRWADAPPASDSSSDARTLWLGDSLGEMALYYGLSDVALLGGSFEKLGGQNLIEAAACGCPVIMGPHTFNFAEASDQAVAAGAAQRAPGLPEAIAQARALCADAPRRAAMAASAEAFTQAHRGAAQATVAALLPFTAPAGC